MGVAGAYCSISKVGLGSYRHYGCDTLLLTLESELLVLLKL